MASAPYSTTADFISETRCIWIITKTKELQVRIKKRPGVSCKAVLVQHENSFPVMVSIK
jgi:hypothetical protein